VVLLLGIASSAYWALNLAQHLEDLGSFLHSGEAYRRGLNPYGFYSFVQPHPISPDALNLNPPISVYPFAAISRVDPDIVRYSFLVGSFAIFGLTVWLLNRAYPERRSLIFFLTLFSLAGLWHMAGYLQIYAPFLLAVAASWLLMRRGDYILAGIAIGLVVTMKPNFILWPGLLIIAGHRKTGIAAIATTAVLSAIPLFIDGPSIYEQWYALTGSFAGLEWASNASLFSVGARWGSMGAGYLMTGALMVGLFAWQRSARSPIHETSAVGLIAVLLFGPASWAGYTLFLLPYLFSRRWTPAIWAGVLMLAVPFWLVRYATMAGPVSNALFGPMYAWALLLLLAVIFYEREASRGLAALPIAGVYAWLRRVFEPAPIPVQVQVEVDQRQHNR
jgi:hypothetical protein